MKCCLKVLDQPASLVPSPEDHEGGVMGSWKRGPLTFFCEYQWHPEYYNLGAEEMAATINKSAIVPRDMVGDTSSESVAIQMIASHLLAGEESVIEGRKEVKVKASEYLDRHPNLRKELKQKLPEAEGYERYVFSLQGNCAASVAKRTVRLEEFPNFWTFSFYFDLSKEQVEAMERSCLGGKAFFEQDGTIRCLQPIFLKYAKALIIGDQYPKTRDIMIIKERLEPLLKKQGLSHIKIISKKEYDAGALTSGDLSGDQSEEKAV